MAQTFAPWLDTFLREKGIDAEERLTVEGPRGENSIPIGCLADAMKRAPDHERKRLKLLLIKVDFLNGDVRHCLRHLAHAIAL